MLYRVETFPAGTVFSTWLRLRRPAKLEMAFFADVLEEFCRDGRVGGRVAIGHGQVRVDLERDDDPTDGRRLDWRQTLVERRAEVLDCLGAFQ